jgi:hypothetical protein
MIREKNLKSWSSMLRAMQKLIMPSANPGIQAAIKKQGIN